MAESTVNAVRLAQIIGVSESRIAQLVNEGMPKTARGKYEVGKCLVWAVKYYRAKAETRLDKADLYREHKTRLLKGSADLKELELAKARGEVIEVAVVEKKWSDIIAKLRQRLLEIIQHAAELANAHPADAEVQLRNLLYDAMEELSGRRPARKKSAGKPKAAAESDGQ